MKRTTWQGVMLAMGVAACGGSADVANLFGAGGAGGASSGSPAVTVSAATTGSTGTGKPGTTASSTGSSSSASSSTASTGPTTTSTGSGNPTAPVYCNNQPCNAGDICCFNLQMMSDFCGKAGMCGAGYIELSCSSPEGCPGEFCCGHVNPNQKPVPYTSVACGGSCAAMNDVVMCSDAHPMCPNGLSCKPSSVLGMGYKVCY